MAVHWNKGGALVGHGNATINEHGQVRHSNSGVVKGAKYLAGKTVQTKPTLTDFIPDIHPPSLLAKRTPVSSSVNRTSTSGQLVQNNMHHTFGSQSKHRLMEFKRSITTESTALPGCTAFIDQGASSKFTAWM
jgi:hypothetical protein